MNPIELLNPVLGVYQTLAVVGAAWGDEAKGKVADFLAPLFDFVVRFSGGANAGHTVCTPDGIKIVTHLLPSGLAAGKTCVIGRGVFFDPIRFNAEYTEVSTKLGGRMPEVWLDHQCTVWTPWHAMLEQWLERVREGKSAGSQIKPTGRGIGPLAGIQALRCDIKVADLLGHQSRLLQKLEVLHEALRPILKEMGVEVPTPVMVRDGFGPALWQISKCIRDTSYDLWRQLRDGKRVQFEGAQATGLDLLWGTNPYVSSGMSTAAGAAYGAGLPPSAVEAVLLVAKVYPTRVGAGPMVSEIWNRADAEEFPKLRPELFVAGSAKDAFLAEQLPRINSGEATRAEESQYFQVLSDERGASTGRGRSVGYPDLPILRYAQRINGAKYLALTKLDTLSGLRRIPVLTHYGNPSCGPLRWGEMWTADALEEATPCQTYLPGWEQNIQGSQEEFRLPWAACDLVDYFDEQTQMHTLLVGTGPDRNAMIVRPPRRA